MEHVHEITSHQEDIEAYEQKAKVLREERQRKSKQIEASIKAVDKDQAGLARSLGSVEADIEEAEQEKDEEKRELKQRLKQLIVDQITVLEIERRKLIQAKKTLEEEAENDLETLDKELEKLEERWPGSTFEKRRSLINFVIKEVIVETVSTHWMRVEVLWLHEEWGREEMYWYRTKGRTVRWTEEEKVLVREHYATMERLELMALLPQRGWQAIRSLGSALEIPRSQIRSTKEEETLKGLLGIMASYSDLEFLRGRGIPFGVQCTNWERLS